MELCRIKKRSLFGVLLTLHIVWAISGASTPNNCVAGTRFGNFALGSTKNPRPHSENTTVIIMDNDQGTKVTPWESSSQFPVTPTCCGKVVKWKCGMIANGPQKVQIWRPLGNDEYLLVWEGYFNYLGGTPDYEYTVPDEAYVQPGDKIGFTGNNIEYNLKTTYSGIYYTTVLAETLIPTPREIYTLKTEHTATRVNTNPPSQINFGIEMQVEPRQDPQCTINLPLTVLQETTPIGTSIGRITTSRQVDDTIPGYNYSLNAGGLAVTVDPITGDIVTTANLTVKTPPNTDMFTLTGTTTEMVCFKTADCKDQLELHFVNYPIGMTGTPTNYSFLESITAPTEFSKFTTTDNNRPRLDNKPNCNIAGTAPSNGPFELTRDAIQTQFTLKYTGAVTIKYALVKAYYITVICVDDYQSSATTTVTFNIDQNLPPQVSNAIDPATSKICGKADAKLVKKGINNKVLQFLVTDKEGDAINSSIDYVNNADNVFGYDATNFYIYPKEDLLAIEIQEFNFIVQFWDKWNRPNRYRACIRVEGINSRPEFSNCPQNIQLSEDKPTDYQVYDIGITDSNYVRDSQSSLFAMVNVDPTTFSSTFNLDTSTGIITLSGTGFGIDYEKSANLLNGNCIRLQVSVTDGIHPAERNCELCVYIMDVNEPPVFAKKTFSLTLNEEMSVPYILPITCTATDPDISDINKLEYSILASSDSGGYFDIDKDTCVIRLRNKCDLEANCPTSFELAVQVKDTAGQTDLAKVNINMININDNTPVFKKSKYEVTLDLDSTPSQVIAQVEATDADPGTSGVFTYNMAGVGLGSMYFTVSPAGEVRMKQQLPFRESTIFIITVQAKDQGSPSLTGYTNIEINYFVDPSKLTTPAPPEGGLCLTCSSEGVVVLTLLVMFGCVLLAFVGFQMYRFCGDDCMDRCSGDKKVLNRDGMYDREDGVYHTRVTYFHQKDLPPSGVYEN